MPIERANFDDVAEPDLIELLEGQVPESVRLEYKRENYPNTDSGKKELLKDVSAFANYQGGHLIIGIEEEPGAGFPKSIGGLSLKAPDTELRRLDQIISSGVEPRIQGVQTKAVTLSSGQFCIVIRVPKSWHPPHRVIFQATNKFYIRNARNVSEPNTEELRMIFNKGSDIVKNIQEFHRARVKDITKRPDGVRLDGIGACIAHIVPFSSIAGTLKLEVSKIKENSNFFLPPNEYGSSPRINLDGYINTCGGDTSKGYTQVFRDGILEIVLPDLVKEHNGHKTIGSIWLEKIFFVRIDQYISGLQRLDVPPPFAVLLTLDGVIGAHYAVSNQYQYSAISRSRFHLPEIIIDSYGTKEDYHRALKPAFDALWNSAGIEQSQYFDENGLWVGRRA